MSFGNLGYEAFAFDSATGRRVTHNKFKVLLVNQASLQTGRYGKAVKLNGQRQYVDIGDHFDICLGNIDHCSHGMTLSVWIFPKDLREGTTYLSTPTYNLFYEDGRLNSVFQGKKKTWAVSSELLRAEEWQRVTLAWHPKKGLTLYINDELMSQDRRGTRGMERGSPASRHVYLGRGLDSDSVTANMLADELQVWYDDLDQLRATGQYRVQVVPRSITFDNWVNKKVSIRDREIQGYGNIQATRGKGVGTKAIFLPGTDAYLDLGSNFTCSGDLTTCQQGATVRLGLRPVELRDGMVFLDSWPVRIYYQNGRLHGQLQTADQVWRVDTTQFSPNQWQRVELTWHPRNGLTMFIDGRRVDYQINPVDRPSSVPTDWRTYFGRALEGGKTFANTAVDSIEFWQAYRDFLPEDNYLKIVPAPEPTTPRPTYRPGDLVTSSPQAAQTQPSKQTRTVKIIKLDGVSSVHFNLGRLPAEYLEKSSAGEFQFYFQTKEKDGVIWFHEEPNRRMYLAMKDGHLVFVNDDGSATPDIVDIGKREGVRFDDGNWHLFQISRAGRRITLNAGGLYPKEYIFSRPIQFLTNADIHLGSSGTRYLSLGNRPVPRFKGKLAQVIYTTEIRTGDRELKNTVNLITKITDDTIIDTTEWTIDPQTVRPVTRPPPVTNPPKPRVTAITMKEDGLFLVTPDRFQARNDSGVAFKFQTIKKDGLLLYATSNVYGRNFLALELYDGKLYFIYNFGGKTHRTLMSEQEVADGQQHEVKLGFFDRFITLQLDRQNQRIRLKNRERLPRALGKLYIGGYNNPKVLPWHTWARESYQGCLEDLQVSGRMVDFHNLLQTPQVFGRVEDRCVAMPKQCSALQPCGPGMCTDTWAGFVCDCHGTDFRGDKCQFNAWTGVFNGSINYKLIMRPQQTYHVNDISLRFKAMSKDGLIFQTRARNDGIFLRAELKNGRLVVTTNLGGEQRSLTVGENLNDQVWHTMNIRRRGNQMEVWVDDSDHDEVILPNQDYYLTVDDVFIGGDVKGELSLNGIKNFIGYIRSLHLGGYDLIQEMHTSGDGPFYREPNLPLIIYRDVTFPTYDSHVKLTPMKSAADINIHFMFKTNDDNGVILLNEGLAKELFIVELFDNRLHMKFDIPNKVPLKISTPPETDLSDGRWHSVSITHHLSQGQNQLSMAVDGWYSSVAYSGIDLIDLRGPLYVGGLPLQMYKEENIKDNVMSKSGFRGCLASFDLGPSRGIQNLFQQGISQNVQLLNKCQSIPSQCTATTCLHGGKCFDHINNGTTWCDCSMTAFSGYLCADAPLGYYFANNSRTDLYGGLVYRYPSIYDDNQRDEIVLGVMTYQKDAVLAKLISDIFEDDFIQIRLMDGYVVAEYNTDDDGGTTTIMNSERMVSNGKYHVIRFIRTAKNGTLYVDGGRTFSQHTVPHGEFNSLSKVFVGGVMQAGKVVNGTGLRGIVGGLNVNGQLIFPFAKDNVRTEFISDVVVANHPFKVERPGRVTATPIPVTTPFVDPGPTPVLVIPVIPSGVGGAGIAWTGLGGVGSAGPDGANVVVYPDGSSGSVGGVPGGLPGNLGPARVSGIAAVSTMPVSGPRAGALMGTLLGIMALISSLMWAFYKCKPGMCPCCAGAGGKGGGAVISAPRAASNMGAVQAATAAGAGSGSGAGALASADGIAAGGAGLGTAIGTPKPARAQFGSTASASGYSMSDANQSYVFEGNNAADYDVATGVHSGSTANYHSNTLGAGSMAGGMGGFSSATMSSNYNYSVKTIKTMGPAGGYGGSTNNIIVTPGAMGEEVRVDCCLMTGDGHSVVTGSSLGPPQVWNMTSGELLRIMQGETVGSTFLHLVNGDRLLAGAINADLEVNQYSTPKGVHNYVFQIWDFASGRPMTMAEVETCSALTVMSDNNKVVFARSDKFGGGTNVVVWDLLANQAIKEMRYDAPVGNNDYVSFVALSQNDRFAVTGFTNTFDNFAEFVMFDLSQSSYNVADPNILRLDANPDCTAILPQEEAVTGLRNGDLVVWNIVTGQPSRQLLANNGKHAHSREVKAVVRSKDNRYLVSASADGTLKLWDLETERQLTTMSGHNDEVWCCAISEDNEIVVSGSRDGTIRLWRLRNGQEICSFNAGVDVFYITMSRDKGTIVALGDKFGARKLVMLQVVRSKVKRQVPA